MMNRIINRGIFVSILMLFLVAASVPAHAADYYALDSQVKITSSQGDVTVSGSTVNFSVKSSAWSSTTSDITIYNNTESPVTISFHYNASTSNTTFTLDGNTVTAGDYTSGTIQSGSSIALKLTASNGFMSAKTATLELTNLTITPLASAYSVTVISENGTVTANGVNVPNGGSVDVSSTGTAFTATANSGYTFYAWTNYETGQLLSQNATFTLAPSGDMTLAAVYQGSGSTTAWFLVDGTYLTDDLNLAVTKGSKVVLLTNGTLAAGDYTIPSGVTLLVPFDGTNTVCAADPKNFVKYEDRGTPTAYRTLTIPQGTSITVQGSIEVGGGLYAPRGGEVGYITGSVGMIKMAGGSTITVKSGGNLYAWGFIARNGKNDEGSITVESGGTAYEYLQIGFRGGSASTESELDAGRIFPVSQYFVQNVEVPLTIMAGAKESLYTGVYALSAVHRTSVGFVAASNAMFNLQSGSFTKDYDESRDRLIFTVSKGSVASLNALKLKLAEAYDFDSSAYDLPINHCITLRVESESTLDVLQNVALLPGVEIHIDENATANVNKCIFVYDRDEWVKDGETGVNYATEGNKYVTVKNTSPGSARVTRTDADLKDVLLDINGTLNVPGTAVEEKSAGTTILGNKVTLNVCSKGFYTTASGANIISSKGTGVVKLTEEANSTTNYYTYQITQSNRDVTLHTITLYPAWLKNGDKRNTALYPDAYTTTAGAAGTYTYCTECQVWAKDGHAHAITITWTPLSYTFTPAYTWDPAQLRYTVTSGTWTADAGGGTVTLESNYPTEHEAEFAFAPSQNLGWSPAMTFAGGSTVTLDGVAYNSLASKTVTATLSGVPPTAFTGELNVGTVTITIRKKQ